MCVTLAAFFTLLDCECELIACPFCFTSTPAISSVISGDAEDILLLFDVM